MIALSVIIALYDLNWDTFGTSLQSVACFCFCFVIIVVPVVLMKVMIKNFSRLGERGLQ